MDILQRASPFAEGSRGAELLWRVRGRSPRASSLLHPAVAVAQSGRMSIIMHDLAGTDPELRFSPYCWRTRFALAHKGLPVETVPWRFTEREALAFSGQAKVPVIQDEGRIVFDSW